MSNDPILAALAPRFAAALEKAFSAEHASADPVIRRSERADFQADVALQLARKLGKPPRAVAEALAAALDLAGVCDKVEIAGPGFLNLTLARPFLEETIDRVARDPRAGVGAVDAPETVVVDYSAPNVAKEMHVGHLRSTIIGDSLARTLELLGHRVVRQNHLGDWGTPFGMLIEHLVDLGQHEGGGELSIGDLDAFYRQARAKFDAGAAFADRARKRVVLLQGGDAPTLELWKKLVDESKKHFNAVYAKLGVTLTDADICGESFYNPMLADVARELEERGFARVSDGALCVFPPGFAGKTGDPLPLIVRKQDGGYGYDTTDLAAIRHRFGTLHATRALYVVGAPQQQHFAMIFAAARETGWLAPPARAEHVSFGSVLGQDKKMFKTRSGETVRLVDLLDEGVERAGAVVRAKNPNLDSASCDAVARKVGIGAIKYADLSSDRVKDYVFDWDRMLALEGNTAPYLQYAHARFRSIFRRPELVESVAAALREGSRAKIALGAPEERALAIELLAFPAVLQAVAASLQPHRLCTYLYTLATRITSFYDNCHILRAEDEATRRSRLVLGDASARTLALGLGVLGIEAPEQM